MKFLKISLKWPKKSLEYVWLKKKFIEMKGTWQKLPEMVNYCWQELETVANGLYCMKMCCNKLMLYELLKVATLHSSLGPQQIQKKNNKKVDKIRFYGINA